MNAALIGAGIAVFAGFGSAVGIGIAASGGSRAIALNPEKEKSIRMITFLGIIMGSACSIYGLLIALIVISGQGSDTSLIGAGIAAIASAGAAIGIGIAASGGSLATAQQPEKEKSIRMITFLGIVLAEACAIYGLLVAFIIISIGQTDPALIGAGIATLAGAGAAVGIGLAADGGSQAIARQPEKEKSIRMITFLGIVLAEACAIYGLLIAFIIIGSGETSLSLIGAGIATLAGAGAAVGIGLAASGGSHAIARRPEKEKSMRMITFLGIVLAEACAIYGLLIAFIIIGNGGANLSLIGAGAATLAGAGAAIGIGLAASGGNQGIARQPEKEKSIRMITFLGIVLAEACAIYGLLVAFIIIGNSGENLSLIGAGAATLAGAGAAIGIGLAASGGSQGIARQPEKEKSIRMITFLGIVLAEACAIYGLLVAFIIIGNG